jgi:hypothetical protein
MGENPVFRPSSRIKTPGHRMSSRRAAFCYSPCMKARIGCCLAVCLMSLAAGSQTWLSPVTAEHRDALAKRLDGYVKANHSQDWAKLFEFISDAARGGLNRSDFAAKMKAAHRRDFSNSPDLLEFQPARTIKADNLEYDVYGCAKAQREGREYKGIALVHAVFQHNDWLFRGGHSRSSRTSHARRCPIRSGRHQTLWSGTSRWRN